jgi:hypothetical protein
VSGDSLTVVTRTPAAGVPEVALAPISSVWKTTWRAL